MTIEIVDFPIKVVIFHSYVSLPEGSFDLNHVPRLSEEATASRGCLVATPSIQAASRSGFSTLRTRPLVEKGGLIFGLFQLSPRQNRGW